MSNENRSRLLTRFKVQFSIFNDQLLVGRVFVIIVGHQWQAAFTWRNMVKDRRALTRVFGDLWQSSASG